MNEKFQSILSNMINGNWTDAKKQVKRFSKSDLMAFVRFLAEHGTPESAINDASLLVG